MNTRKSIITIVFAVTVGIWLTSCDESMVESTFPHKPHHAEEMECEMCHEPDGKMVTMPVFDVCLTCHEPEDDTLASCNTCHEQYNVEPDGDGVVSHKELFVKYLSEEWQDVEMDHEPYFEMGMEGCLECHSNIPESMHSSIDNLPSMKVTMDIHKANDMSNDCQMCHKEINTLTPPPSHDQSWDKHHGFAREFQDMDSCLMCHQEDTCNSCHEVTEPQSHTNQFRRHTHGLQAAFDRESCLVCHRNDECESCHKAAADPVPAAAYHNPGASCTACHVPQGAQRPANRFLRPMPHRLMMGTSSQKCLSCHLL